MTETRTFPLGVILTVTTEQLVAPFADLHEFLEYMAGEPVWTHQLPRVNDEAKPVILAQHPQLATVRIPDDFGSDPESAIVWLAEQVKHFGEALEIRPLAVSDHRSIDPISELRMRGIRPVRHER
jgi:hypothetical protein